MAGPSFLDLVTAEKWHPFIEHAKQVSATLQDDVDIVLRQNETIRLEARNLLEADFDIRRCAPQELDCAQDILMGGRVAAIDGTHAVFPMLSGVCCQIGVATTSYENKKAVGALIVSEQQVSGDETSVLGILKRRKKSQKIISRMLIQAVMFYMERQKAVERDEEWLMFNGDLVPQPLRTGIGSFRALDPCLDICRKCMAREKIIGVLANSTDSELLSLGLALEPGEYIALRSYKEDLDEYLESAGLRGNDRAIMQDFNATYADHYVVGVYRAGAKAYVFQAHRDFFDQAAAIVIRDSMFQPLRAYPLLIDYADALCSTLMSSSEFIRMIECKLAKGSALTFEQDEHTLRRR